MKYILTSSKINNVIAEFDDLTDAEVNAEAISLDGMLNQYDESGKRLHWHYKGGVKQHEEAHG